HPARATPAAVPRLRLRVQARRRRRPAAGQRRTTSRIAVPGQRHSATRSPSATMTRRGLVTVAAIALAVALIAGAVFLVRQVFFAPTTITAYFPTATSIYPGDDVRISGVKVGKIDSIVPEGTQTKMTLKVDRDVPIPADAKAVVVAQ